MLFRSHSRDGLTVVTASLTTASLLGTRAVRTIATGGEVLRDELTTVGPIAVASLERYRFDIAVIGAAGLSASWGITELTDAEAEVQRVAIGRAERVVALADGSKIGAVTPSVVGPASAVQTLVTDPSARRDELAALAALNVEIVLAGSSESADATPSGHRRARRPVTTKGA